VSAAGAEPAGWGSVWAVLLAGGRGTRFWPASRGAHPKQFLRLLEDRTLLRATWDRFARILPAERILVVTSPGYAEATRREIPELLSGNLVLEPSGHDTAPAIALAAREARARDEDALLVVAPTDHFIGDEAAFRAALVAGIDAATTGSLVTFGVRPDHPATGFGYIEVAAVPDSVRAVPVVRFHEKPDRATARTYLDTGRFLWNAGIFAWGARRFASELASAAPDLAACVLALPAVAGPGEAGYEAFAAAWENLPSISIDYALLEKSSSVAVVPLAADWSDVGSWDAVRKRLPRDPEGNRAGQGVLYVGSRNCSVHRHAADGPDTPAGAGAARPRLYVLAGLEDLVVVETEDAVLVCREGAGEALREIVARLRAAGRADLL